MRKVEKKFGLKFSSSQGLKGRGGAKTTTLWYETEAERDQYFRAYANNPNYRKVKSVDKK